jgi:hypothetical protein
MSLKPSPSFKSVAFFQHWFPTAIWTYEAQCPDEEAISHLVPAEKAKAYVKASTSPGHASYIRLQLNQWRTFASSLRTRIDG